MLTTVPGYPRLTITGETDGQVTCTLDAEHGFCGCGRQLRRDGRVSIKLSDVPWGRRPTRLAITAQRWSCAAGCSQHDLWAGLRAAAVAGKRPRMTVRLVELLTDRYLRGAPATTLAVWCGVKLHGLRLLLGAIVEDLLYRPRSTQHWATLTHLGIDEIFWRGRVLCVIVDLVTGQLLELLPDREPETLRAFLTDMNTYRTTPPIVVTDMWGPFRDVLRTVYGPGLRHVCDRFHIQAKISEDLRDAARLILLPGAHRPRQVQQVVAHALKAHGEGGVNLTVDGASEEHLQALTALVSLAAQAAEIWRSEGVAQAEQRILDWSWQRAQVQWQFQNANLGSGRPFGRLDYLLHHWRTEMLHYFDPALALPGRRRPSSGRLEAANGKIRKLLLTSGHARRNTFAEEDEDQQGHFNRLWVRVMHRMNAQPTSRLHLSAQVRPAVPACRCGAAATELAMVWRFQGTVWACPVGDSPVKIAVQQAETTCRTCGSHSRATVDTEQGMTRQLYTDVLAWRREGLGLRTLHRMTGVPVSRLRTATAAVVGDAASYLLGLYPPPLIGLQRWRWRGQHRWVITDPAAGTLVDILEGAPQDRFDEAVRQLREWLTVAHRRGLQQVMVGDLMWADHIPGHLSVLADRFTVMNAAHRVLRDVLWQVTASLPVAARRAPELHRHRFVVLAHPANYRRRDDKRMQEPLLAKRTALLGRFPALTVATDHIEALREIFKLPAKRAKEIRPAMTDWLSKTWHIVSDTDTQRVGVRTLEATLTNVRRILDDHQDAVIAGLRLQAEQGISLAASRRLIRSLNEHPAAAQPDFEFLRSSARHVLRRRP